VSLRRILHTTAYGARIALGSLWAYRLRSFLTALGVMIGVATVIAIDGIVEGLNQSFRDQVASLGTGTLYVSKYPWIILGDAWRFATRPQLTPAESRYLEEHLSLAQLVVPFVYERSTITLGSSEISDMRVIGSNEHYAEMSGLEPTAGRFLVPGDTESRRPVVVVGADVAEAMKKEGLSVGDKIRILGEPLQVIGVMPGRGSIFGQSQDDYVVVTLPHFERFFGRWRSVTIGVVTDPEHLDRAADEIAGALRTKRGLAPEAEDNFSINQQQMFVDFYAKLTRSLYATAIGLALITLVVGGVGIMNIMLVAVAERTQEIGVRKALGARPNAILMQFLAEAAMVSGLGGVAGTTLGLGLSRAVAELTPLPALVPPAAIGAGVIFGAAVGVLFGFLPAYRAARLLPVVALRAE
jgi:putative ABC transport system permease protein